MSARDWLNRELADESQTGAASEVSEEPWFDAALSAAAAEMDLSDRTIDLLVEIGQPRDAAGSTLPAAVATDPAIKSRREALGMSMDDAARQIGVSAAGYEALERSPLRWLNVPDTGKVAAYLAQLDVSRGEFLRWLASLRPAQAGYAWGYRPGAVLDRPVAGADDDQEHFLAWGMRLLHDEA
jgi:transcriptional regulator with XRE-family HTH domain